MKPYGVLEVLDPYPVTVLTFLNFEFLSVHRRVVNMSVDIGCIIPDVLTSIGDFKGPLCYFSGGQGADSIA